MAKRPVPRYDFKAFGAAIKAAREGRKESRKKVGDEMFISPRYLANIENKGQHPSLQIFFELIQRYHISVLSEGQQKIQSFSRICLRNLVFREKTLKQYILMSIQNMKAIRTEIRAGSEDLKVISIITI